MSAQNLAPKFLGVGPEFSGKTHLCNALSSQEPRLIKMMLKEQAKFMSGHVVRSKAEFTAALRKVYNHKRFRITWIVKATDETDADKVQQERSAALEHVFSTLTRLDMVTAPVAVDIDETDTFILNGTKLGFHTRESAKQARHGTPTPLYMTCHKTSELHHVLRNNVQTIAIFKTKEDATVTYIAQKSAGDKSKAEIAKLLNSLGKYEYLQWSLFEPIKKMPKYKK